MENLPKLVILLSLCGIVLATSKPVLVRDSSTAQLYTSSLLTWESFNNDPQQLMHAVVGGTFQGGDNSKAYICRSTINSIPVSGYVKKRVVNDKEVHICLISQHSQFRTKQEFDVLLNKGNGAKLEWVKWEKMIPFDSINGAVTTVNGASRTEVYYVARHERNHTHMEHHEIDQAIGWFDPSDGLGKIYVTVASEERSFDQGEILTATEAIRYELHDFKFSALKLRQKHNRTLLGQTVLKNEGDDEMDVNAVIGYEFDVVRNFGTHDGIARSIETTAFIPSKADPVSFYWGIQKTDHAVSSKGVGTKLLPGTAMNITLWGKYTTNEGPYRANLVTYWADGTKSKKRAVLVTSGLEQNLEDQLEIEHSPTYWLHNNTVVPTTTQRTVTSTSTQSVHKSIIFSTSMSSNEIEKITERMSIDDDEEAEAKTSGSSRFREVSLMTFIVLSLLKTLL